jgi:hypothetical protein
MAVYNPTYQSATATVGTSATLIASFISTGGHVVVTNTNTVTVFLGGANVTTANGLPVLTNTSVLVPVPAGQQVSLYGIVAVTAGPCSILYVE